MKYKFKFKRKWFWKTIKAKGHNLDQERDVMTVFLQGGGLYAIPKWSQCQLWLGVDWELATKKQMEEEAGQEVKIKEN